MKIEKKQKRNYNNFMGNIITLYHGSHEGIEGEIAPNISRDVCDFGKGFYTGDNPTQAKTLICEDKCSTF